MFYSVLTCRSLFTIKYYFVCSGFKFFGTTLYSYFSYQTFYLIGQTGNIVVEFVDTLLNEGFKRPAFLAHHVIVSDASGGVKFAHELEACLYAVAELYTYTSRFASRSSIQL